MSDSTFSIPLFKNSDETRAHIDEILNPKTMSLYSTVMFTGPTDIDSKIFEKYYQSSVKAAIDRECTIHVGNAVGTDAFVQAVCVKEKYFHQVKVFIPQGANQEDSHILDDRFQKVIVPGRFKERDRAMRVGVHYIFAHFSQYGGAASGTAANVLSVVFNLPEEFDGYHLIEALRKSSLPWNSETEKLVKGAEADEIVER